MIRVKMLPKNETCIIDNGKVYLFGLNGKCTSEDSGNLSKYMTGALDLPVISILSCNGYLNVGVSRTGCEFKQFDCSLDAMECAMKVQLAGKFIKMLRRDGVQDGKKFNQLLFVYQEGFDISSILTSIGIKEV